MPQQVGIEANEEQRNADMKFFWDEWLKRPEEFERRFPTFEQARAACHAYLRELDEYRSAGRTPLQLPRVPSHAAR